MYLDAPVYIWGVQCIYTAYLTGRRGCVCRYDPTELLEFGWAAGHEAATPETLCASTPTPPL